MSGERSGLLLAGPEAAAGTGAGSGGAEGQTDQAKGNVKQAGEKVKDVFKS